MWLSWFLWVVSLACWACFNHLPDVGVDTRPVNTLSGSELAFGDAYVSFVD